MCHDSPLDILFGNFIAKCRKSQGIYAKKAILGEKETGLLQEKTLHNDGLQKIVL
jgi:hypothetical protein